jgi:small-conductance mechanosensitive channel
MELPGWIDFTLLEVGKWELNLGMVLRSILVIVVARSLIWLINLLFLNRYFKKHKFDLGRKFAIRQIITYIIYTITVVLVLQELGFKPSVLLASSAALLVGIGLGLQQTFNDMVCGLILAIEGTVEVGDIVVIGDVVGYVKKIGFRVSRIITRDDVVIIVPNSKLITDNVINWSHNEQPNRFSISISIPYDADLPLVSKLLIEATKDQEKVLTDPGPRVQLVSFGAYALEIELYFWSWELFRIEQIKSKIRFRILDLFREHQVNIAFPQQEITVLNKKSGREFDEKIYNSTVDFSSDRPL